MSGTSGQWMPRRRRAAIAAIAAAATLGAAAAEPPDADKGQIVFEQLCGICHAVSADGSGPPMGPNLFGLLGRKAGEEPNYAMYTPALKAFAGTWDVATLDEFLKNPLNKVPGTSMPVMLPDATDRANVIAYLSTLK